MSARMLAGFPYPVPGVDWRGGKTHQEVTVGCLRLDAHKFTGQFSPPFSYETPKHSHVWSVEVVGVRHEPISSGDAAGMEAAQREAEKAAMEYLLKMVAALGGY